MIPSSQLWLHYSTEQKSSAPCPFHRKHTKGLVQKKKVTGGHTFITPEKLNVF